jgi:glutaconyl-CoA/methylmalonyl-CoA decarboxylase subunit gamma
MPNYYAFVEGRAIELRVEPTSHGYHVALANSEQDPTPRDIDIEAVHFNPRTGEGLYSLLINHKSYQLYLTPGSTETVVELSRHRVAIRLLTERDWRLEKIAPKSAVHSGKATVAAPMPGLVKSVLIEVGAAVTIGTRLLVLEAMKMENDIASPRDGTVTAVHVTSGSVVEGGKALVEIE